VELRRVLRSDADGDARAAALFVLSYSTSGADVVGLCGEALSDPDSSVRGAALQIMATSPTGIRSCRSDSMGSCRAWTTPPSTCAARPWGCSCRSPNATRTGRN